MSEVKMITVTIPVIVEKGDSGLVFVTSPLIQGLLVSEREWLDFISSSAGLPMITIRTYPDPVIQAAIVAAATAFEERITKRMDEFTNILTSGEVRLLATERRIEREMQF